MTRISSRKPAAESPSPLGSGSADVDRLLTLRNRLAQLPSVNVVELPPVVIHRSTYFGLASAPDTYPDSVTSADHRAIVRWERRRERLAADLPDDGGFSSGD